MRNTHTRKMQESTGIIFLIIFVLPKAKAEKKYTFFSLFLPSKNRNKHVKTTHLPFSQASGLLQVLSGGKKMGEVIA